MTATEILNIVRRQYLDDIVVPYLWSDEELIEYLNEAQDWMCEEALVIQDSSTATDGTDELCVYALDGTSTAVTEIDLNPKVIAIKKARLVTSKVNLILDKTIEQLDEESSDWDTLEGISDSLIYKFYDTGKARLVPALDIADTLKLTIYRYPVTYASLDTNDAMEVPTKFQRRLINKILAMAYSKQDVETEDLTKSNKHEQAALLDLNWVKKELIRFNNQDLVASPLRGNL